MLKEEFSDIDTMQQYICTVASNDSVFSNRPQDNPDISELATYILQKEIQAMAQDGAYSGMC